MMKLDTITALVDGEKWVLDNIIKKYGWPVSKDIVEQKLKLEITSEPLDDEIEVILMPSPNDNYNGKISLNSKYQDIGEFEYMHEVIHYLMDVGVGRKVQSQFLRRRKR